MLKCDPISDPEASIRRVYSYVAYRIGQGADAEDVTNDVMLRAVKYRTSYDPAKGKPATWLLAIARKCLDDHLASRPLVSGESVETVAPGDFESETLRRLTVTDAVARLDDHDRELIALRYGADLSTRQIAAVVGLSPNAVDVGLHRARQRLSVQLHREGYGHSFRSNSPKRRVAESGA